MNLILTIAQGNYYFDLGLLTHPSIRKYADKCGADFLCITKKQIASTTPHWEKFQIYDLLNDYERILFLDTDLIIRDDTPNLFELVPPNKLGLFNEAPFTDRSKELLIDTCKEYGTKLSGWNGKYYNTGVMVISRKHKYLFKKPTTEYFSFYEQTYLNMKIAEATNENEIEVHDLEYRFNRMSCLDRFCGEDRHASYIIHYAGCPSQSLVVSLIKKDLEIWNHDKNNGGYKYKKHIHISVTGGLGDQICAEPAIRFLINNIYKNDELIISSHWPRVFKHLDVPVYQQGKFQPKDDTPYYLATSLPSPETITWFVVSNLLCHTVDYCSIALGKRMLPMKDKTIQLLPDDEKELDEITKTDDYSQWVVVHPGKHWQSKTFPDSYWQEIIDKLSREFRVAIIGKDDNTRGTVNVKCPDNAIDLRNLLDLGSLITLISKARVLISNDSAPIHIAGAFDNWIILLPSCKHPDHVLPYRNGNIYHKAFALFKKLPADEFVSEPTCVHGSSAEFTLDSWDKYLAEPEVVLEKVKEIFINY